MQWYPPEELTFGLGRRSPPVVAALHLVGRMRAASISSREQAGTEAGG
jgi:hypothetical protein